MGGRSTGAPWQRLPRRALRLPDARRSTRGSSAFRGRGLQDRQGAGAQDTRLERGLLWALLALRRRDSNVARWQVGLRDHACRRLDLGCFPALPPRGSVGGGGSVGGDAHCGTAPMKSYLRDRGLATRTWES
eukprot:Amastigsp_a1564_34.p2 type:complete len:132 gc:universal Amastigsp_a1564_34:503-898(+)